MILFVLFVSELYDNLGKVGASLKENIMTGMKNMWDSLSEFARSHTAGPMQPSSHEPPPDTPSTPVQNDTQFEGTYVHTVCMCVGTCVCTVRPQLCMYIRMCVGPYVCTVCTQLCTYVCTCV